MTVEQLIKVPQPHPAQVAVLQQAKRFNAVCLGRRSGKTKLGIILTLRKVRQGLPVGWFAPTYQILLDAWRDIRARLAPMTLERSEAVKRIAIWGGGSLECWSLDNPDAGRSRKYARVVIDEAASARNLEEAWTASIRPTLTDYRGDAWFLSTPKGINYYYHLFHRATADPDWASWQMPTTCNPYIDPDEVESARKELPSLVYQQEYLAQFVNFQGTVLRREWLKYGETPPRLTYVMGVDLAISTKSTADWTAAVILTRDALGRIYVAAAARTRAPFSEVLIFIHSLAQRYNPVRIGIEVVQYQAAVVQELLRTTSLPVQGLKPDRDKLTRFLPVAARYEQGLIWHDPSLPADFEQELLTFPEGEHDDYVDAASYAFQLLPEVTATYDYELADSGRRGSDTLRLKARTW